MYADDATHITGREVARRGIVVSLRRYLVVGLLIAATAALFWQTAIIEIGVSARFSVPTEQPYVALSFDDGPDWGEEALITVLNEYGISATFFWIWEKIEILSSQDNERFLQLVDRVDSGGHELGIHGYPCQGSYNPITRFLVLNDNEEITKLKTQFVRLTRQNPTLYRGHGPRLGRSFYQSLNSSGTELILGSLTSQIGIEDPANKFVEHIEQAKPGTIICGHSSSGCAADYGLAREIALVVPDIDAAAKRKKISIVTVGELLGRSLP